MAATGKTPILLYGSTTATNQPSAGNLTNSSDGCEIAINVADKNLFFKDSTNTVNTVPIRQSSASSNGWLSSTDWSTFNSKQPAGNYLTSVTSDAPLTGAGTSASHLSMPAATGSVNGYLTSTDWTMFNNKVSSQWTTSGSTIYYTTGPVGVGTTSPQYAKFDVTGVGTGALNANIAGSNSNKDQVLIATSERASSPGVFGLPNGSAWICAVGNGVATELGIGTYGAVPLVFATSNTEAARVHSSGGVSIGNTTDPGAGNLSVNNQIYVGGTSGLLTGRSAFYSNQAGQATFRNTTTASGKYFFVGPDGGNSFLIENQSSTGVYLADGGITWSSVSDIRLKEIIEPIKNAKEKLSTLRTIIGRYKTDNESVRRPFLIAQDVQLVLPEAVSKYTIENHGEEYLGLEYANLIPLIIAAINEISVSITNIEAKIDNLV